MASFRLFGLVICFILLGCADHNKLEQHLVDYQVRMANVLDIPTIGLDSITLPPFPKSKTLSQSKALQTIKLFEFYQLKHCELYSLVAERNTTLGRLQLPSIRYVYEKQLIHALEKCIAQTEQSALRDKLKQWHNVKINQIDLAWADLMQLSSEIKTGFSANFGLIEGTQLDGLVPIKQALHYLLKIQDEALPNSQQLEDYLKTINDNPLPAKIWLSQLMLTRHLNASTHWLTEHQTTLTCDSAKSKQQVEYLTNVFQLFFIEKIQPIAGQLNHYHYQLAPTLLELSNHAHLSESYKQYIQAQLQNFQSYQLALKQHIKWWQDLFKTCNMAPGNI